MNIEIADEQIERLVQSAIQQKVNEWFNKKENKDIIKAHVFKCVYDQIQKEKPNIQKLVKEMQPKRFAEQLTTSIAYAIADEFCDRYGG